MILWLCWHTHSHTHILKKVSSFVLGHRSSHENIDWEKGSNAKCGLKIRWAKSTASYLYSESPASYKYWKEDTGGGEETAKWCIWEMAHLSTAQNIISSCQISSHLIKIIATFIVIINSVIFTGAMAILRLIMASLASSRVAWGGGVEGVGVGLGFSIKSNAGNLIWENHS